MFVVLSFCFYASNPNIAFERHVELGSLNAQLFFFYFVHIFLASLPLQIVATESIYITLCLPCELCLFDHSPEEHGYLCAVQCRQTSYASHIHIHMFHMLHSDYENYLLISLRRRHKKFLFIIFCFSSVVVVGAPFI